MTDQLNRLFEESKSIIINEIQRGVEIWQNQADLPCCWLKQKQHCFLGCSRNIAHAFVQLLFAANLVGTFPWLGAAFLQWQNLITHQWKVKHKQLLMHWTKHATSPLVVLTSLWWLTTTLSWKYLMSAAWITYQTLDCAIWKKNPKGIISASLMYQALNMQHPTPSHTILQTASTTRHLRRGYHHNPSSSVPQLPFSTIFFSGNRPLYCRWKHYNALSQ